jgi:hypothetical protein
VSVRNHEISEMVNLGKASRLGTSTGGGKSSDLGRFTTKKRTFYNGKVVTLLCPGARGSNFYMHLLYQGAKGREQTSKSSGTDPQKFKDTR